MSKETDIELKGKITSATVQKITDAIEHDQIILNVAKELLKEVVTDAVDLENTQQQPRLQNVIDHIKAQEWSDLFAESALRTVTIISRFNI